MGTHNDSTCIEARGQPSVVGLHLSTIYLKLLFLNYFSFYCVSVCLSLKVYATCVLVPEIVVRFYEMELKVSYDLPTVGVGN